MKSELRYLLHILLFLNLSSLCAHSSVNKLTLGATSRVCLEVHSSSDLLQGIEKGIDTFIPGNISETELAKLFNTLSVNLNKHPKSNFILINIFQSDEVWFKLIETYQLNKLFISKKPKKTKDLFTCQPEENKLIFFTNESSENSYRFNDYITIFKHDSTSTKALTNDLALIKLDSNTPVISIENKIIQWLNQHHLSHNKELKTLLKHWSSTGKRPHFIWCQPNSINRATNVAEILNRIPFWSVNFTKNKQAFAPVKIKENNHFLSGGRVSIPIMQMSDTKSEITPISKGFRFSPDIFRFTPEHNNQEIVMHAFPLDIEKNLLMHFHFDKMQTPGTPSLDPVFSSSKSMQHEDSERGKVFYFNGQNDYIDCGSDLNINFNEALTISAWIKPEKINQNHSIIGLGNRFSFKVRQEQLTFTLTDIIDIHFDGDIIKNNEWQHVAIINEPNSQVSLFLNGNKIGTAQTNNISNTEHALLIGSNIWGEYYKGYLDDLMIWNRALSDEEIMKVSQISKANSKNQLLLLISGLVVLTISIVIILWLIRKRSLGRIRAPQKPINKDEKQPHISITKSPFNKLNSCILLFDEFQIRTSEGDNIASSLSPKEKQLFIYLLWHTIRSKNGGITSRKLSEDLWPGMSSDKAKNNRSTYMQRLRKTLTKTTGIQISYNSNKKWCLSIPATFQCDLNNYVEALYQLRSNCTFDHLQNFLSTLGDGQFLPETHNEVIDVIKNEIENEIIVILTEPGIIKVYQNNQQIIPIVVTTIRKYDPLSETALTLDLQWLNGNGHHGRALETYQRFCNDFEALYCEKFSKEMEDLLISSV